MKSNPIVAIFPGTFDPITLGHEDLISRAIALFDWVWVAVANGHHKRTLFDLPTRLDMVQSTCATMPRVGVLAFEGLLSDVVKDKGAHVLLRGVRSSQDFDYEYSMAGLNRQILPNVETVFLPTLDKHQFISSTYVREIAMLGGDVSKWVSPAVLAQITQRSSTWP
jgi:pantetheine-phosphate adenylyltransferase